MARSCLDTATVAARHGRKRRARTLDCPCGAASGSRRAPRRSQRLSASMSPELQDKSSRSPKAFKARHSKAAAAVAVVAKRRGWFGARGGADERQEAVRRALRLYEELWREFDGVNKLNGFVKACERTAESAAKRYKELHEVALALLLRVGSCEVDTRRISLSFAYRVLTFHGRAVGARRGDLDLSARLALHNRDAEGRARIALCSVLACLCSRVEKAWLEDYDDELPVRGYFAHALVNPASTFRVALGPRRCSRLACLLITKELSLSQAFENMDHGGPLPEGHTREPTGESREYGLQRIAVPHGRGDDRREALQDVNPEEEFKALLRSETKVLLLDVYCALAPRERVREHSLGEIIREELTCLLCRAKEQGVAVVFQVGGEDPTSLAEKVYLKPHLVAIGGLRCGYLRWREGPDQQWAAMQKNSERVLVGLQLPSGRPLANDVLLPS